MGFFLCRIKNSEVPKVRVKVDQIVWPIKV